MDAWNMTTEYYTSTDTSSFETGNETASVLGPKRDSLLIVIPMTIIYVIIFFTGVIGNVSTCIVIARNKSMHTATNYYLFSLAVSDLLLLVTGLPQEMYSIWSRYPYVFGEAFCILRGLASETSANATVLTITAFTVERYVAICHPFLSHTMSKLSRAVKLILAVWLVAFSFAVPQALQFGIVLVNDSIAQCHFKEIIIQHSFELSTFLFFVAPMTLITVLYALIGLRLRTSNMMKRTPGQSVRCTTETDNTNSSRKSCRHHHGQSSRRVLKMLVAVVVAFFICWAPFHAQRLVAIYGGGVQDKLKIYEIITYVSGILYYVSTTVNPVLYHIMSNKFREAFKETFSRCLCGWGGHGGRSSRLSDRRSCYSVLSRSGAPASRGVGRNRNAMAQESTDSGTSLTHRHSEESMCMHPSGTIQATPPSRHGFFTRNDTQESTVKEFMNDKFLSEQFRFDTTPVVAMNKLNAPKYDEKSYKNRSRVARFKNLFRCIAKKTFDDNKHQPYDSPVNEQHVEPQKIARELNDRFNQSSYDVSNSSLRDIENGALEDELTIYMKEIQRREKDKS